MKKSIYVVLRLTFYYAYICLLTNLQIPVNHSSCHFSKLICSISTWLYWKMEKAMATHSSTLGCKIPWTEEPGRLQSMGSLRVRHDWATSLSLLIFMHWRRKWQPTPVFLPGESQGRGSLVGCCLYITQNQTRLKQLSSSSSSILKEYHQES